MAAQQDSRWLTCDNWTLIRIQLGLTLGINGYQKSIKKWSGAKALRNLMLSEGCYSLNLQFFYQIHGMSAYSQAQSMIFIFVVVLFLR